MSKFIKKLPILALCIACVLGLAACASGQSSASSASSSTSASSESATATSTSSASASTTEADTNPIKIGENVLVVYFSATGNTAAIAQDIATATSGSTFEITPAQPYTAEDLNYNDTASRVSQEHNDAALQDASLSVATPENWDSYDTVFIGYPIWWGEAAWPVDSFVKANDFTGKNVIPFCTSASSSLGNSANELAQLAGTGTWGEGMRFPSGATQTEVDDWLDTFIQAL